MSKIIGIYKITSPSGKIYIGQSIDVMGRFKDYKRGKGTKQSRLYNSFTRHGITSHTFELIEECALDALNERECFYISHYGCFNTKMGLNLTSGGDSKGTVSEETKRKISIGNTGKVVSDESRKKMSVSQKNRGSEISSIISKRNIGNKYANGRKLSPDEIQKLKDSRNGIPCGMSGKQHSSESIEKMRQSKIGKKKSAGTGLKISLANKGKKKSEEWKEKIRQARLGKKYPRGTKT